MTDVTPHLFAARNIDPDADNAIHGDDVAQQLGFHGALVPGVELFAGATSPLVAAWGEQWLSNGHLELRFRRPVYDEEKLLVELHGDRLTVTGPDAEVRCVGSAGRTTTTPDTGRYVDAPLPATLPVSPPAGVLGSLIEPVTAADNLAYVNAVGEPLRLYAEQPIAHPGLLLRLVNLLLMRNVALGPWVHTASSCDLVGAVRLPAQLTVRGTVTGLYQRNGHDYVRYDALVLADGRPAMAVDHTAIYRLGAGDA